MLFLVETFGAALTISAGDADVVFATVTPSYNNNISGMLC